MKAFITGASGFAGSHLAEHLLDRGDQVMGASTTGRWRKPCPRRLVQQVPLLAWDLSRETPAEVRRAFRQYQPDWVFHLAAIAIPRQCGDASPGDPAWQVNVEGTRRVVELAAASAPPPRFLLASSSHVYAPVPPESPRVREDAPLGPEAGYGRTKLAAEQIVRQAADSLQMTAIIARTFHHAGPRQDPQLMPAQWCRQLAAGTRPLRVHNCDSYLDLSDVRDVVRAYRAALSRGQGTETVNVGSGVCYRTGDLLERLLARMPERWEFEELYPGRRQHPIADTRRLQEIARWQPAVPIERTLADSLDFWRQHPDLGSGKLL